MREAIFTYIDLEEIEAISEELEPDTGYHIMGYEKELLPHVESVACWCGPVLVFQNKKERIEIWAHPQTKDNPQ